MPLSTSSPPCSQPTRLVAHTLIVQSTVAIMAHDTSNVTTPVSEESPPANNPPFSLPQDISSPVSEIIQGNKRDPPFSLPENISSPVSEVNQGNKRVPPSSQRLLAAHLEYARILKFQSPSRNGNRSSSVPNKDKPGLVHGDNVITTSKDARRGVNEEWSVPARKRLARVANAQHKVPASVHRPVVPGRSRPTAEDFRSTAREGAALDPALSADEDVEDPLDDGAGSSLVTKSPEKGSANSPMKKKAKVTGMPSHASSPTSMVIDPPEAQKLTGAAASSLAGNKAPSSKGLNMSSTARNFSLSGVPRLPSDKMNVDSPAVSLSESKSAPGSLAAKQLRMVVAQKGRTSVPSTPGPISSALGRLPATTPHNGGLLTRTPSTSTSISNPLLPNLAKASLADMKSMREIYKAKTAANVLELRRAGHHLIAPSAFEFQDHHLRMVTRFCDQLDRKIDEAESAGILEEIEVIDLTIGDEDDSADSAVGSLVGSKRRNADDSPVESKKARTSATFEPPNLGPYGFRSISDKDALAGIPPRFPVNKQPSLSEFISQSNPSLMHPIPTSSSNKSKTPMPNLTSAKSGSLSPVIVINSAVASNLRAAANTSGSSVEHTAPLDPSASKDKASATSLPPPPIVLPDPSLKGISPNQSQTLNSNGNGSAPSLTSNKASRPRRSAQLKDPSTSKGKGSAASVPPASNNTQPLDPNKNKSIENVPSSSEAPAPLNGPNNNSADPGTSSTPQPSTLPPSGRVLPDSTLPENSAQNKDMDVVDEGVDELEEQSDKEEAPKKRGGKGKGKAQKKTPKTPKPPKTPRLKVSEMTPEQKLERDRKSKQRKEEKDNCVYAIPPQPGALLAPMWPPLTCEEARIAHKDMLVKSRNPHWNYGPELMDKVAKIVKAFGKDFADDEFYTKMDGFKPDLEAIQAFGLVYKDEFLNLIPTCPRLVQVDAADPFFKEGVVDLSMIKAAHDSDDKVKASSWQCLYGMMIRTDEHSDYTEDPHTVKAIDSSFRKIHTLTQSCFDHFHHYVLPSNKPVCDTSATWKQDTMFQSGEFVLAKIKALKAGAQGTASHGNKRTGNGLMILQKRIWETLFCCLMMQQALFLDDLDHCIKTKSFPNKTMVVSQYMTAEDRSKSLFKTGDVKDLKDSKALIDWGQDRLAAFGSMAIFFLYGAAGWWQCLTDSHNYNQKDVWALVYIAEAKADWLYNNGHYHERTPQDTPWYRIDGFVRWLLHKTNMHLRLTATTDTVDWQAAPRFWNQHVTEQTIARLALQDILAEVCSKSPRKSLNFNGEAAPDVVVDKEDKPLVDEFRSTLTCGWNATIRANEDAMTSQPGPGEDEGEANGGGEGEANGDGEDEEAANGGGEDEEDPNETQEEGGFIRPSHSGRSENSFATRRGGSPSEASSSSSSDESQVKVKLTQTKGRIRHRKRSLVPSSSSDDSSSSGEDEEETDIARSDTDGGLEERSRRRAEHPMIEYSAGVSRKK
ncbi:Golgi to ER traffic- protein [Puccinia graminis f. sp. tritici]|uniref:Golgi to ER traffic-protein n=2 Tax=Puccinia graminis f. sp. tritici TaxID=56615 RepID=A0A5B0N1D9_PUCGR|nr:Golgi to ER traffic- protein [Puccinia graminis f. sp. tritici]